MEGNINFKFEVGTCLTPNDIIRLRQAGTMDEQYQVLLDVFGEDMNIWEGFYTAAMEAFGTKFPDGIVVE